MSVFKRGNVYWYEFVFNGRRIQRSTKQHNKKIAIDIESAYRTSLAKGEVGIVTPKEENRTIGDLLDAVEHRYSLEGKLTSQNVSLLSRVREDFGTQRCTALTSEFVADYISRCRTKGTAPATINRRLQVLHRCYTLAGLSAPKTELLPLDNARSGFFSPAEMAAVLSHLPDDGLRDFVRFAHATGMRLKELQSLRWENLQDGVLKLAAKDSKNRNARTVPVDDGDLAAIVERRKAARMIRNSDGSIAAAQYLFHRGDGLPIGQFRKSWKTACVAAGVGALVCPKCGETGEGKRCKGCKRARQYQGRIFHDIRRSAVRDLIRAGVPQSVAMSISGHKTLSMFSRYNITDESDKRTALAAAAAYREQQQKNVVSMSK